jgi:hypothetical protein
MKFMQASYFKTKTKLMMPKKPQTFGSANWISGSGVASLAGVSRSEEVPKHKNNLKH